MEPIKKQQEVAAIALIYVVCPNLETAKSIGLALVERQEAACANILPVMHSIYRWEGKVEQANEVVLLLKTRTGQFQNLVRAIISLHPYDTPAIFELSLSDVEQHFRHWILSETTGLTRG